MPGKISVLEIMGFGSLQCWKNQSYPKVDIVIFQNNDTPAKLTIIIFHKQVKP